MSVLLKRRISKFKDQLIKFQNFQQNSTKPNFTGTLQEGLHLEQN